MKKLSKRIKQVSELVDKQKAYNIDEAIAILKKAPKVKFNESVQVSFKLNLDQKDTGLTIRGTCSLPHGTGKTRRVLVFCKGENMAKAKDAGADIIGSAELVEKIEKGFMDFDVAIATPDIMKDIARLGKVLGPRGLMPSPKAGTVTDDVVKAINEIKGGRIEFKMDKESNMHALVGKLSFEENKLKENAMSLIEAVNHTRPTQVKGQFIKSLYLSSTMGPGIKIDTTKLGLG